jgi:predicted thioesterase
VGAGSVRPGTGVRNVRPTQGDDRVRVWATLDEFEGRAIRVVTLADGVTIHNAFLDRNLRP